MKSLADKHEGINSIFFLFSDISERNKDYSDTKGVSGGGSHVFRFGGPWLQIHNVNMWRCIGKGPIWWKWSYSQGRVVWTISKHLRPIPSPTVENSLKHRHPNLKNEKSENFKMLRNHNFNIFPKNSHFLIMYVNK